VRTTQYSLKRRRPLAGTARFAGPVALCCLACVALLVVAGCSGSQGTGTSTGSSDASPTVGAHMAGPAAEVHVTQEALASKPQPWVLTTPESAVRSYLDWTSYAYRIGQSSFATATMSSYEEVRVDSYVQYNIQKSRLIDQTLKSITFGKANLEGARAIVPAKEQWTYRYVSIDTGNKTLAGPYTASYDTTYTVVKSGKGWVVDSVKAKDLGTVK
jgi:hypothetical protein